MVEQCSDYYEISYIDEFGLLCAYTSPGPHPSLTPEQIVEGWRTGPRLKGTGWRLVWTNEHGQRCAIALSVHGRG